MITIISEGLVGSGAESTRGLFLMSYDPEAHDGRGDAAWTADPAKALKFESVLDALHFWKQVPASRPVRPDGKPNRPLTAFTITLVEA